MPLILMTLSEAHILSIDQRAICYLLKPPKLLVLALMEWYTLKSLHKKYVVSANFQN